MKATVVWTSPGISPPVPTSAAMNKDVYLWFDAHTDANFRAFEEIAGRTRQRPERVANPGARFHRLDSDT